MNKYRIIEKNGLFYPQRRNIFWPFYSFFEYRQPFDQLYGYSKRKRVFGSLEEAKQYIGSLGEKKNKGYVKIHTYP